MRQLAEPARRACNLAVQSRRDVLRKGTTPSDRQSPRGSRFARERVEDLRFGDGPNARNLTKAAALRGLHKLVHRPQIKMARDMNCPLRGEAEHAPESDESRIELRLEIAELRDLAGLDQLAQLRLDSRANAAHVAYTTRADKLCDRCWRGANELCGPQVRAHCE